ncbi:MAG: cupredoxin family copper-binding protein [Litorilinea sp.]
MRPQNIQHRRPPQSTTPAMHHRRTFLRGMGGLMLLGVAGCSPIQTPRAEPTALPEPTSTSTPEPVPPRATETPATPTPEPTATPSAAQSTQPPVEIEIQLFMFQTQRLEIPLGTTVTWINRDDIDHSVTSGVPDAPDGQFDSGLFPLNQQFSHTFTAPGEFPYYCTRHPHMVGTVIVSAE